MKLTFGATALIVALMVETICAGTITIGNVVDELAQCKHQLVTKTYTLAGTFFDKTLISNLLDLSYDMYYKQHMTLNEITNYFIKNFRNIGLQADQIDTIVDVINNLAKSMDGPNEFVNFYSEIGDTLLQYVGDDQQQIDEIVAKLQSLHASDDQIKLGVCQQVVQRVTDDRILKLVMKLLPLVPADIQQMVVAQVGRIFGLSPSILSMFNLIGSASLF